VPELLGIYYHTKCQIVNTPLSLVLPSLNEFFVKKQSKMPALFASSKYRRNERFPLSRRRSGSMLSLKSEGLEARIPAFPSFAKSFGGHGAGMTQKRVFERPQQPLT
jgi:hypothetical protein